MNTKSDKELCADEYSNINTNVSMLDAISSLALGVFGIVFGTVSAVSTGAIIQIMAVIIPLSLICIVDGAIKLRSLFQYLRWWNKWGEELCLPVERAQQGLRNFYF